MAIKPGYKQTEVGVIPEDWQVVQLDSIATRGSGHTPSRAHSEYWNGQIKWISLADSDRLDRHFIGETAATVTSAGIANSSARLYKAGTVVVTRDAGVGKSAIMSDDMAVSQHFMAWSCGPNLNNHFLYYWLQDRKLEFERIASGNTIKTIGLRYFTQLKIAIPAIKEEQEAIAEALSDADALVESLEELIAKKRHLKQGAMQELLTGKRRLPGFEVKAGYKSTDVGPIPEDWDSSILEELAKISSGTTPSRSLLERFYKNGTVAWVKTMDLANSELWETSEFVTELALKETSLRVYPPRSVLVAMYGGFNQIGRTGLLRIPAAVNQAISALQPTSGVLASEFLLRVLNFRVEHWKSVASSSRKDPNITSQDIKAFEIAYPAFPEQEAIANILIDMDAEIDALEQKLDKARQIKQGMMQELLTGKTRLV